MLEHRGAPVGLVEAYMSLVEDVQAFVREANRITEVKELRSLLEGIVQTLGFDYFALVHHVNIYQTNGDVVYLFDFPQAWADQIDRRGYFSDDPVLVACEKSAAPFAWSEVSRIVKLTGRQQEILQSAKDAGLGGGFTVPIHVPGEHTRRLLVQHPHRPRLPRARAARRALCGLFAFEAARRLVQRRALTTQTKVQMTSKPKLTRRQLDCVVLAGRGKSDRDVGQILGISDQTVHQHMEEAKRKYEVATRMQLVVRALFDSQLAFADLVN